MTGRRVLLATSLLAVAGVLASLGLALPETSAPERGPRPALATPLWSLRRYPLPITTAVTEAVEQRTVTDALTRYVGRFDRSCFVVRRGNDVIAASEPDAPLLPASTEKLLTATAALDILGPEFRYTTNVVSAAAPFGGVVERVWMVGAGDPSLSTAPYADRGVSTSMEELADSVVASGVRRITAGIAVDDFRYDSERVVPSWPGTYISKFESGLLGALTANHGIPLVNGKPVTAADPGLYAAAELTALLRARGVTVIGEPTRGAAPPGAVTVGSVTSVPLRTLIGFMLQISDNLAAELLTKELGLRAAGAGTTAAGTAATMAVMNRMGVPTAGIVMVDGSGLDRGNRVTCRALAAVAARARERGPRSLAGLLPPAATGTSVQGRVAAKGGYLTDVIGLAGLLDGEHDYEFAFLANSRLSPRPIDDINGFAEALAAVRAFQPASDGSGLVPQPSPPRQPVAALRS